MKRVFNWGLDAVCYAFLNFLNFFDLFYLKHRKTPLGQEFPKRL